MYGIQIRDSAIIAADAEFIIYISGLRLSTGSTYSTRFGPSDSAALGCANCIATTTTGVTTPLLLGSFDKPLQNVINITVELKDVSPNPAVYDYTEKWDLLQF